MTRRKRNARSRRKVTRLAIALIPVVLATGVVAASTAIKVKTPIALEMSVRALTFTIADEDRLIPLLNNRTPFSRLLIEGCETVSLPSLIIGNSSSPPTSSQRPVMIRCDRRVPGSKVFIQSKRLDHGPRPELGSIASIAAKKGDTVGLELTNASPPEIRVEVARTVSFEFSLNRHVPFELVTEFADVEGASVPIDSDGVTTYQAIVAGTERGAIVDSGSRLNMVVEPAGDKNVTDLFRSDPIPIASVSLFRRSDVDDALVSTAINGTLRYASRSDEENVTIHSGQNIRLRSAAGFSLTQRRVDREQAGLSLTLEGDAIELSTNGIDRRLRLFDRLTSDRNRNLLGIIAIVAGQLVWLRKRWRSSTDED